jgi:hypothetical protein
MQRCVTLALVALLSAGACTSPYHGRFSADAARADAQAGQPAADVGPARGDEVPNVSPEEADTAGIAAEEGPTVDGMPECPSYLYSNPLLSDPSSPGLSLKTCLTDGDCVLRDILHCPGLMLVVGLSKSAICKDPVPGDCGAPANTPILQYNTEDERSANDRAGIRVECQSGFCQSAGSQCGQQPWEVCPNDHVCVRLCGESSGSGVSCQPLPAACAGKHDDNCLNVLGGYMWMSPRDVYVAAMVCLA